MNQSRFSPRITSLLLAAVVCGVTAHASAGAAQLVPYALGKLPDGFTVHWPTAPKITRSVDVSTSADFNKAAAVDGTMITVKAAIAGHVAINASDIEVRMDDSASLGGLTINRSVKRVALLGGH